MPTSLYALALPDVPGAVFLAFLNGVLQAISSFHSGSAEPPVKQACMPWMDLSTNTLKIRDTANVAWLSLFRITNAGAEPIYRGQALGPLATLTSESRGYLWSNGDGSFTVQDVSTPDIPIFGVGAAGMVPGPTAAQTDAGAYLRADGSWRFGPTVQTRRFAGAQDYSIGNLPRSEVYHVRVYARLSNAQSLVLQVGNGGTPKQTGYANAVSRSYVAVAQGVDSLSSGDVTQSSASTATWGFEIWDQYPEIRPVVIDGRLVHVGDNLWTWVGHGGWTGGGVDGDSSRGTVSLTGQLDFVRILPCGNPRGTFNSRASMNDGSIVVWA